MKRKKRRKMIVVSLFLSLSLFFGCAALISFSRQVLYQKLHLWEGATKEFLKERKRKNSSPRSHSSLLPKGVFPPLAKSPKSVAACFPTTAALYVKNPTSIGKSCAWCPTLSANRNSYLL